jgi:DHA1 family tetracycline resistance protein-like MFS transporter
LQGANASVGSIAGIASPLFFGWVYAITIGTAPGVSFLIAAAILLASAAIGGMAREARKGAR